MALDSPRAESTDRGQRPHLHNTPRHRMSLVGAVSERHGMPNVGAVSDREASIAHRAAIHLPMDNP
jgi:hypothetical protein